MSGFCHFKAIIGQICAIFLLVPDSCSLCASDESNYDLLRPRTASCQALAGEQFSAILDLGGKEKCFNCQFSPTFANLSGRYTIRILARILARIFENFLQVEIPPGYLEISSSKCLSGEEGAIFDPFLHDI